MTVQPRRVLFYRVWRWHFFAGLMVIPISVLLAITGALYVFKPQVEAAIERGIHARAVPAPPGALPLSANELMDWVQAEYPASSLQKVIVPAPGDRTLEAEFRRATGTDQRFWVDVFSGDVLHAVDVDQRFMKVVQALHGELLLGGRGSLVVELVASWMIVLIVTGLFLWWPRGAPWWRVFLPAPGGRGKRGVLKNWHGMMGAWVGGVVLLILLSGLPWTQVWGGGFAQLQKHAGWAGPGQEWVVTLQSSEPPPNAGSVAGPISLQQIIDKIRPLNLPAPIHILPPKANNGVWTVRSMTQNRPQRVTLHYDQWTGEELMRIRFADQHPVGRVTAMGIAFHEGQLFGLANQIVVLAAALGVVGLSVTGGLMWWRRRPQQMTAHLLSPPPLPDDRRLTAGVMGIILLLALVLPLVGLSLVAALGSDFAWSRWQQRPR